MTTPVPSLVSAVASSPTRVTLNWKPPGNTALSLTYNVYRNGSLLATTASVSTTSEDGGVSAGTAYSYTVSAVDGSTEGNVSNAIAVTTPAASAGSSTPVRPLVGCGQAEVDFGTTPVGNGTFTITDASVTTSSHIVAEMAYEAPTSKDLDEIEMDDIMLRCQPGTGQFTMFARSVDHSLLADKFKINYFVF